jgi:hypothetical protein
MVPGFVEARVRVMRSILRSKFFRDPALARALLATGTDELRYDARNAPFWGYPGENAHGKILADLRLELASIIEERRRALEAAGAGEAERSEEGEAGEAYRSEAGEAGEAVEAGEAGEAERSEEGEVGEAGEAVEAAGAERSEEDRREEGEADRREEGEAGEAERSEEDRSEEGLLNGPITEVAGNGEKEKAENE